MKRPQSPTGEKKQFWYTFPPPRYSGPQPGIYDLLSVYDILIAVCPQGINTFTNTIPFLCILIEARFK